MLGISIFIRISLKQLEAVCQACSASRSCSAARPREFPDADCFRFTVEIRYDQVSVISRLVDEMHQSFAGCNLVVAEARILTDDRVINGSK